MKVTKREILNRAVKELNEMTVDCDNFDPENMHSRAEDILCELLTEFGFGEAAKAFEDANSRVGFWYA